MTCSLFDTHCHPQFPQYDEDRDAVIRRALNTGVGLICVGTDLVSSEAAIKLSEQYEGLWATVGLHPNDALRDTAGDPGIVPLSTFESLIGHKNVVAVGEIGLDYYRTKDPRLQEVQRERFAGFLDIATRNDLPVVIHCRDAHDDMIHMLSRSTQGKMSGGVIHSFTGTWEQAQRYIELGYHIGLNGIITFARDYDETVLNIPLKKVLLETDAPYLTPKPYRGQRNDPSYVIEVAKELASRRSMELADIKKVTTENTLSVFSKVNISMR